MAKSENWEITKRVLRIEIDGYWTVHDMTRFLSHTQDLYNFTFLQHASYEELIDRQNLFFDLEQFFPGKKSKLGLKSLFSSLNHEFFRQTSMNVACISSNPEVLNRHVLRYFPGKELQLQKIIYGSPGFVDLVGIGEAVGHIKDFILKLVEYALSSEQRRLENEERKRKIQKLRLENIKEFIHISREIGFTDSELRDLIPWIDERQGTYFALVEDGKIKRVLPPERIEEPKER